MDMKPLFWDIKEILSSSLIQRHEMKGQGGHAGKTP
jgi:hypothetical protein